MPRGWGGRPKKTATNNSKLVFAMKSRANVWAPCDDIQARAALKKFDAAMGGKKPAKWFSLEPYAIARVRVEDVEAVYYLGPAT